LPGEPEPAKFTARVVAGAVQVPGVLNVWDAAVVDFVINPESFLAMFAILLQVKPTSYNVFRS
jgi:hypothetical protein